MRAAGCAAVLVVILDEQGEGVGGLGRSLRVRTIRFEFVLPVLLRGDQKPEFASAAAAALRVGVDGLGVSAVLLPALGALVNVAGSDLVGVAPRDERKFREPLHGLPAPRFPEIDNLILKIC